MALHFDAGEDFARDKPALHPCPNLDGFRCTIHDRLDVAGYSGCARYDCLGAGQRVTTDLFPGADWHRDPALRAPMAEAFATLRRVHTGLELIAAAESLRLPPELDAERASLFALFHPAAGWTRKTLADLDLPAATRRLSTFLTALRPHV